MKTYAEKNGKKPFDWNKFLNNPPDLEDLIAWEEAEERSGSWVTCACGNQCSLIKRRTDDDWDGSDGAPIDEELESLGGDFHMDIIGRNIADAKKTLAKIEKRSIQVLKIQLREADKEASALRKALGK